MGIVATGDMRRGSWGAGHVLVLVLGDDYISVFPFGKSIELYTCVWYASLSYVGFSTKFLTKKGIGPVTETSYLEV